MESLRTQLDNLRWEVNRLDSENRRLRDEKADVSARLDLEAELEESKAEGARMAERVRAGEQQLEESRGLLEEAGWRAEEQVGSLERTIEATRYQLQETTEQLRKSQEEVVELHKALTDGKSRMEELAGDVEEKESELRRQADHAERQS